MILRDAIDALCQFFPKARVEYTPENNQIICYIRTRGSYIIQITPRYSHQGKFRVASFDATYGILIPAAPRAPLDRFTITDTNDLVGWMIQVRDAIQGRDLFEWILNPTTKEWPVYNLPWTTRLCWETGVHGDMWPVMISHVHSFGLTYREHQVKLLRPAILHNDFPVGWVVDATFQEPPEVLSQGYVEDLEGLAQRVLLDRMGIDRWNVPSLLPERPTET